MHFEDPETITGAVASLVSDSISNEFSRDDPCVPTFPRRGESPVSIVVAEFTISSDVFVPGQVLQNHEDVLVDVHVLVSDSMT